MGNRNAPSPAASSVHIMIEKPDEMNPSAGMYLIIQLSAIAMSATIVIPLFFLADDNADKIKVKTVDKAENKIVENQVQTETISKEEKCTNREEKP